MKTKHISIGLALVCLLFGIATLTARVGAAEGDQRYTINQNDISPRIILFTYKVGDAVKNITASSTLPIKWVGINLSGSTIDISLIGTTGTSSILLASSTPNDGQETVAFPANLPVGDYRIQLKAGANVQATTWAIYRIQAPKVYSLTITSPTASTTVMAGNRVSASWTSQNLSRSTPVTVTLVKSTDENTAVASYGTRILGELSGTNTFLIPSVVLAGQYKLKASLPLANGTTFVASSSYFTVTRPGMATSTPATSTATTTATSTATTTVPAPTFTFSNITASTTATAGRNLAVSWTSTNVPNQNQTVVKLVNASSTEVAILYAGALAPQGTGTVLIPRAAPAGQYRLKWISTVRGVVRTATSSVFSIVR